MCRTLPILSAFFVMGFGDASGPLVGLAKDYFGLTDVTSVSMGFLVPLACGSYMLFLSFLSLKKGVTAR